MDRNIGASLETQSHAPVLNLDHRDFEHLLAEIASQLFSW